MRPIAGARFAIVSNGFADGPAQALRDFLVTRDASVVTVFHPLVAEAGLRHRVAYYVDGAKVRERSVPIPLKPPLSFAADPFVPLRLPRVDAWFGFNSLACGRGLVAKRLGRAGSVVQWCVDFVPDRFGKTPLTMLYDKLDRACCLRSDLRVELSAAARDARDARHHLSTSSAPTQIVPMGAWLDRVPIIDTDGWSARKVVFLGHLVPRQGVAMLLEALAVLHARDAGVTADIIGTGPDEEELRQVAERFGLLRSVRFHGFVEEHEDVEAILAEASVAVAPYEPSADTFTRFADPGKLKAYLAAGLPIVLTDVPPNAAELAAQAGAEVVPFGAIELADAIGRALADGRAWQDRRSAALGYARHFDWNALLPDVLAAVGFQEPTSSGIPQ